MQFGRNSQVEFPGEGALDGAIQFLADGKIVLNGIGKSLFEFINGASLKSDDVGQIHYFSGKNVFFGIVFEFAYIPFVN